jgi:hypothetical protein
LCSEGLSLGLAVLVASLFEGEKHSAHTADARRVPVSDASQLTTAQSEVKKGGNNLASHKTEDGMKRERALQVVLVLVGLFYCFWGYLLFDDLSHSRWLSGHSDVMPMFLSLNTALGVCLLLAVNQPAKHRLMIAYGAWSTLAHGITMTIMSAQAVAHGMHRKDSPQDIVIMGVIGVTLLALLPAKQPSPASAYQ